MLYDPGQRQLSVAPDVKDNVVSRVEVDCRPVLEILAGKAGCRSPPATSAQTLPHFGSGVVGLLLWGSAGRAV